MRTNTADRIAWVVVIVGSLNWGLVGAFRYNLVETLFGVDSTLSRIVYILIGVAAVYAVGSLIVKLSKGRAAAK